MSNLLWLFLIPVAWALIARFALHRDITWKETGLMTGGSAFLILFVYICMAWSNTSDTLILNGYVEGKEKNWVSCDHSYRCRCYTTCSGSGSNKSCSEHCSTCYDHANDWDWDVKTTVGTITIDRIDRRGSDTPPRWTAVVLGEPAALHANFTNYIKAAPNSLFNTKLAEREAKESPQNIPKYPRVFDYYRVNHVVEVGTSLANKNVWNDQLSSILRLLGSEKQVNIVMVFTSKKDRTYAHMLERAWLGGKKNDVIIVVGTEGEKIEWVEAFTFGKTSGNGMLAVQLRDSLQALGTTSDPVKGVAIVAYEVRKSFVRKEMKDYEYLKEESGPSSKQISWLVGSILVLLSIATFLLWKYDVFSEGIFVNRLYRNRY